MIHLFRKDLKLFLIDKRAVILTFLLPIVLITLFALAFGGIFRDDSSNPIDLLISDLDHSVVSIEMISKLDSLRTVQIEMVELAEARDLVFKGDYPAVLVLNKGIQDSVNTGKNPVVELIYDRAREMEVGLLQPILISAVMSSFGQVSVSSSILDYLDKSFPNLDKALKDKLVKDAMSNTELSFNNESESVIKMTSMVGEESDVNLGIVQAVAGTAILMLLFSVARIGASILDEKESGTLNRLLYSPLKPKTILLGKMLVTFFIALIQLTVMFIFAWITFGLDILTDVPALILMIVTTAFAVSSFGIFLAAISRSYQQAQSLSTLMILIMSAIGGSMIPLFIMPVFMKRIAVITVNYWGMEGFFDIFWRNLPIVDILPKMLVLVGMGLLMTMISLRLFKRTVFKLV